MDFKAARADEFGEKVAVGNSGMGVVGKLPGQGQDSFGLVEIELSFRLWHGRKVPHVVVARKRHHQVLWSIPRRPPSPGRSMEAPQRGAGPAWAAGRRVQGDGASRQPPVRWRLCQGLPCPFL